MVVVAEDQYLKENDNRPHMSAIITLTNKTTSKWRMWKYLI